MRLLEGGGLGGLLLLLWLWLEGRWRWSELLLGLGLVEGLLGLLGLLLRR